MQQTRIGVEHVNAITFDRDSYGSVAQGRNGQFKISIRFRFGWVGLHKVNVREILESPSGVGKKGGG